MSGSVQRRFHHRAYPAGRLAAERDCSISVVLPARDEESTITDMVGPLMELVEAGAIDQVLVADDSRDRTAARARAAGAEVVPQADVLPEHGPLQGKGDAMWRGLAAARGELVCFLDADTRGFGAHFACGLLGPLVCEPRVAFVKGAYRRPFDTGLGHVSAEGGGRVTELIALPLLRRFHPELAWLRQPLAGEIAARRELLEQLPFTCGYGVDVGLLLDAVELAGPDAVVEADLGTRQNRHRPLRELGPMADEVLGAVCARLAADGRLVAERDATVTPPHAGTHTAVVASGAGSQTAVVRPGAGGEMAVVRPPLASLALEPA